MASIRIDKFGGIAPLIDPKKLPGDKAQLAVNCTFDGTDLRPVHHSTVLAWTGIPLNPSRIYQWRGRWLGWGNALNVDVAASPVPNDSHERLYWTIGISDIRPRFADRNILDSNVNMTNLGITLGIDRPNDTQKPQVVVSAIGDVAVDAVTISQASPARVSTAVDHPFSDGQRVVVTLARTDGSPGGTPDTPPDRTGMVEINGKEFVVRAVKNPDNNIPSLREFDLIGADGANYSEYAPALWTATIKRVFTDQDMESRAYVYTYVSIFGEESQPSPPSDPVDVLKGTPVEVQFSPAVQALAAGYTVRLYRSVTGSGGTHFFLVKDNVAPVSPYRIVDDTADVAIGEMLPSETWAPPPAGLTGLVAMPNGFFAAFKGNTLYFCEPYQPHAWPFQYTRTTQDEIVGIAVFGQTLVVATKGKPYMASGVDPSSMTLSQLDVYAPCKDKATVVSVGSGVVFASHDGLVHVSGSGVRVLTEGVFSKRQWSELIPFGVRSSLWHDGRLFMSGYLGGRTLVFEPTSAGLNVSEVGVEFSAMAVSTDFTISDRDAMTVVEDSGTVLSVFNAGDPMTAHWVGRVVVLSAPVSMACGQVWASDYPVTILVHAARLRANPNRPDELTWPSSDGQVQQIVVNGPEPFRLAGGFLAREWRIDIQSSRGVQAVVIATSMDELREQ